ncbi:hypothetical protein [Labilibacter marinus]|uniref:hypothetical protein n=1 Tax=Labilibacter marinus TaxID=1477105 RepID=UPI00082B1100|nr:hypothetical protein [Labilibacter marinus]
MKQIFILLSLIITFSTVSAQNFDFSPLKEKSDYKKVEEQVKSASKYLIDTPINQDVIIRSQATKLVMKWMEGTPDYTFELDARVLEITDDNSELFSLYLASMTNVVLNHPHEKLSSDKIYKLSTKQLAEYCKNKENKLKPSKGLKKAMKNLDI